LTSAADSSRSPASETSSTTARSPKPVDEDIGVGVSLNTLAFAVTFAEGAAFAFTLFLDFFDFPGVP